jgi:photosystem II stability/assembly factor-like uncharacterized protein
MAWLRSLGAKVQKMRIGMAAVAGTTAAVSAAALGWTSAAAAASPAPESAVGNATILWVTVSPAYATTGLVLAVASDLNCTSSCAHLWVTRDRGASWRRLASTGWSGAHPVIAVGADHREVFYDTTSSTLIRSTDQGATWSPAGDAGAPAVSPSYPADGLVAVAGKTDYVIRNGISQPVSGSHGAMSDNQWTVAPGFPSAGGHTPVFLGGVDKAGKSAVARCDSTFSCGGSVVLPVPDSFAGAPLLVPSSAYAEDATVFAQTADGIFKSTDGAGSFAPLTLPVTGATRVSTPMMALSQSYQERGPDRHLHVAVLATRGTGSAMMMTGGVYSSADGGTTWLGGEPSSPFHSGATAVAAAPDGRLFAGFTGSGGAGLLCSVDGTTWHASCPASAGAPVAAAVPGASSPAATGCAAAPCATASQPSDVAAGAAAPPSPPARGAGAAAAVDVSRPGASSGSRATMPFLVLIVLGAVLLVTALLVRSLRRKPTA